jgi:hypothetical protein
MKQDEQNNSDFPKIGAPATRALEAAGYSRLEQLTKVTEAELGQLHGMGPNALGKLSQALAERGLSFCKHSGMDKIIRTHLDNVRSEDGDLQNKAYYFLMDVTEKPVNWAYEAWDELVEGLTHKDNHVRAISSQALANLAKSDPKGRMLKDFDKLLAVTKDEKFVTARHCLQSLWKVGLAGKKQQKLLLDGFAKRFEECAAEKNCTLIRFDIVQGLRNLYNATTDETVKETALALIETESDLKYRKKYADVWKSS